MKIQLKELPPDVAAHLEKSVESVPHVQAVRADLDSGCVVIEHDGANTAEVASALREEGVEWTGIA